MDAAAKPSKLAAQALADYATALRYEDIPPEVIARAKACMLDTIAVASFGASLPWCRIVNDYALANSGAGKASVLGAPFIKEDYGIAFPRKGADTLRNKVDTTLLKMREDGSYQRIYDKWFGKK